MKVISTLSYWCLHLLLLLPFISTAQDGTLDPSFGNGGKVFLEFARPTMGQNVIQQPDGKLIVVASATTPPYELYVARLNTNGSLDPSFGTGGRVHFSNIGHGSFEGFGKRIALRSDGKIVIVVSGFSAGPTSIAIITLNPDGSLASNGNVQLRPGMIYNEGMSVALLPNNDHLIGGITDNGSFQEAILYKMPADWGLNNRFEKRFSFAAPPLGFHHSIRAIRVQKDGKIVLGMGVPGPGSHMDFAIVRLNPDGSYDNTFNGNGIRLVDFAGGLDVMHDIVIQEDCKILAVGWGNVAGSTNFALTRLLPNGTLDNSFDRDGKLNFRVPTANNRGYDVNVQQDGKIIVIGTSGNTSGTGSRFSFFKLNYDGSFDNSFGTGGTASYNFGLNGLDAANDGLVQQDGKVVAVGQAYANGSNGVPTEAVGLMRLNNTVGPTAPFTCNYTVQGAYTLVGSARTLGGGCYELTPSHVNQAGAIWFNSSPSSLNLNQDFSISAQLYFGASDAGADGIAFVLQPVGTTIIGEAGGGLGYMNIKPSLAIEFDTYRNHEPWFQAFDPLDDHLAFMENGSPYHVDPVTGAISPPSLLLPNIEDNTYYPITISWDAARKRLSVEFRNNTYSYPVDILNEIFGGNPNVYFGFTAATGSPLPNVLQNVQRVCNISIVNQGSLRNSSPSGLSVLPNPTTGNTFIKLEQDLKGAGMLSILSSDGTILEQRQITLLGDGQIIPMDLGHLKSGMYFVRISSGNKIVTQKLIRQ